MIKRMESTYCIIELDSKGGHDDLSNVGTNLGEPHFKRKGNMENGRGGVRWRWRSPLWSSPFDPFLTMAGM